MTQAPKPMSPKSSNKLVVSFRSPTDAGGSSSSTVASSGGGGGGGLPAATREHGRARTLPVQKLTPTRIHASVSGRDGPDAESSDSRSPQGSRSARNSRRSRGAGGFSPSSPSSGNGGRESGGARRNSDALAAKKSTPQAGRPAMRKMKTLPAPCATETRRAELTVPPQDMAKLHSLHDGMVSERNDKTSGIDFISDEALDDIWSPSFETRGSAVTAPTAAASADGGTGSAPTACAWHIFTGPTSESEKPYSVRRPQLRPKVLGRPFIKDQGVGIVNCKGMKGPHDCCPGQDACSVSRLRTGWDVLCLMDGHGIDGDWPSSRGVRTLPYILEHNPSCATMLKHGQVSAALHLAFEKAQADLVFESLVQDIRLQIAGSTAVCVMYHEKYDSLWVANCGDSRAALIVPGEGIIAETVDHKLSLAPEAARLDAMGCEVVRTEHEDGFVEERINLKGCDYPGLCMSRSLGDLCVKHSGVTCIPEVYQWDFCTKGKDKCFLLIASDGVWEHLSTEECAKLVIHELEGGSSCQEASEVLAKRARAAWHTSEAGRYCDDITILLVPVVRKPREPSSGVAFGAGGVAGGGSMAPRASDDSVATSDREKRRGASASESCVQACWGGLAGLGRLLRRPR